MAENTKISWTNATWNPITGCSVVSPGCTNCYAMKLAGTRLRNHPSRKGLTTQTKAGPVWTGEVRFNEQWISQPLRWKRSRMIFVCAHGDLFHESVPVHVIDKVFSVMALAPQHIFQVLTKRGDRMRDYLSDPRTHRRWVMNYDTTWFPKNLTSVPAFFPAAPLPNVWLGVSVEDQERADKRILGLIDTPAAVRFLSVEPQLERIDLSRYLDEINWVICGAESGPGRRPFDMDWARDLRDQCAVTDTAFFFKQAFVDGKKVETPELDGSQWTEFPR